MTPAIQKLIVENLDMLLGRKFGEMKIIVAHGKVVGVEFDLKVPQEVIEAANNKK